MILSLTGFCEELAGSGSPVWGLGPARIAREFVRYTGLSAFPDFGEVTSRLLGMENGSILPSNRLPPDMRGIHYRLDSGAYAITYAMGASEGARSFTVLHETHEIIYEILAEVVGQPYPKRRACREADRFAAAVLMQPGPFSAYALATGLDVVALRDHYGLSCAALTLRLGEVMRAQPMLAVLYERREEGDPGHWVKTPSMDAFRASVAVRTPGFGSRDSRMLCGARGLMPVRGRPLSPGSMAESVVLTGRARYAEIEPGRGDDGTGDMAMAARPVVWKGRVAKVAVIAVPYGDRSVLSPQLSGEAFRHRRESRRSAAGIVSGRNARWKR